MPPYISTQSGQLFIDGALFGQVPELDLITEPTDDHCTSPISNFRECSFSSSFMILHTKFNKKTIRFYRKYLLIDLLAIKFPKKTRRKKRINRKWKKSKSNIIQILTK